MATEVGTAYVSVIPSAKGFGTTLDRGISRQVDTSGKNSGRRFGSGFRSGVGTAVVGFGKAFVPIAAAAATIGGARLFGNFIADARESARISALTAQAIKSTGGAANVTTKDVGRLATAISNKTGIDDEQIQSGANLLLTFTNIRNELGRGNKIFNQANQAVTDMSAALGQDTKSSAIQLGKALNDPVKGITALSRVGVAFTQDQKDQIKTMVASGNTLGAQKVILKELGKEFGGAAAAMATPGDKLKVTLGNLGESIGAKLIPYIDRFANFMLDKGIPALIKFGGFVKANILPVLLRFGGFVKTTIVPALQRFGDFLAANVLPKLRDLGDFIQANVLPRLKSLGNFIRDKVIPVLGPILRSAIDGAKSAFDSIKDSLQKNRGAIESFVGGFKAVVTFIVTKVLPVLGPILKQAFILLGQHIGRVITVIANIIVGFQALGRIVVPIIVFIAKLFLSFVGLLINGAAKAFGWVPGLGGKLKGAADAFNGFKTKVDGTLDSIAQSAKGWGTKTGNNFNAGLTDALIGRGVKKSVAVGVNNKVSSLARTGGAFESGGGGGDIIVNNPIPEPTSESVDKALRRKRRQAGWSAG